LDFRRKTPKYPRQELNLCTRFGKPGSLLRLYAGLAALRASLRARPRRPRRRRASGNAFVLFVRILGGLLIYHNVWKPRQEANVTAASNTTPVNPPSTMTEARRKVLAHAAMQSGSQSGDAGPEPAPSTPEKSHSP
jgi:hypothetical protein